MAHAIHAKGVDGKYHCPDLNKDGQRCSAVYDRPTALGVHRRYVHKVMGTSTASLAFRKAQEVKLKAQRKAERIAKSNQAVANVTNARDSLLACPDPNCTATFTGQRWLSRHVNTQHPALLKHSQANNQLVTTTKGTSNGHIISSETEQLTPGLVAELIAVGYIQARIETIANENNLPVRQFGKRVAGYLFAHSGR